MGILAIGLVNTLVFQSSMCPEDWLQDMERLSNEVLLPLLSQPPLGSLWDSLRYVLCRQQGDCGMEAAPLLRDSWVSPIHPKMWPFKGLKEPKFPAGATLASL